MLVRLITQYGAKLRLQGPSSFWNLVLKLKESLHDCVDPLLVRFRVRQRHSAPDANGDNCFSNIVHVLVQLGANSFRQIYTMGVNKQGKVIDSFQRLVVLFSSVLLT